MALGILAHYYIITLTPKAYNNTIMRAKFDFEESIKNIILWKCLIKTLYKMSTGPKFNFPVSKRKMPFNYIYTNVGFPVKFTYPSFICLLSVEAIKQNNIRKINET